MLAPKTKRTLLFSLLALLSACSAPPPEAADPLAFTLNGRTRDLPDGARLYLRDILTNQTVDSTLVEKNRFYFEGRLPDDPSHFYLHTADYAASKSLWLEPGEMVLDASESELQKATLSGSQTQARAEELYARLATTEDYDEQIGITLLFIREFPDSRVSASVLAGYSPNVEKERARELYDRLSEANRRSVYGRQIARYLELNRAHRPGDRYSDFSMKDPEGAVLTFSDHLGKVTLLEFWASWCGPCRQTNPELVALHEQYRAAGFRVFAVSLDFSADNWQEAIRADGLPWPQVSDLKGRNSTAALLYGVNQIPDNFLIGPEGRIVERGLWGEELRGVVDSLLSGD